MAKKCPRRNNENKISRKRLYNLQGESRFKICTLQEEDIEEKLNVGEKVLPLGLYTTVTHVTS